MTLLKRPRGAPGSVGLFLFIMTAFFDYVLPPELIAQEPCPERDRARLLVVERANGQISHRLVRDLPHLLAPGDVTVFNDTRVLSARLVGKRAATGGRWEGLFLRALEDGLWEIIGQTRGRLREGETVRLEPGPLELQLRQRLDGGRWLAEPHPGGPVVALLEKHGQVPLPPYIRKGQAGSVDQERYQTVYGRNPGAVAAPTAGLHFTPELLANLESQGVDRAWVTLHVGLGTFRPITTEDPRQHQMHSEWGELPEATVAALQHCRERRGRVLAVGTTTVRVLETVAHAGPVRPWSGETSIFIHSPWEFRLVDALLTNFHLPRTTLLLLVGAFAGEALLERAYQVAIAERYRFYSYGDAMLIL